MEATRAAEVLFGCFRTGGAAEPEIFVAGVAAVLSDYPASVVQSVVDPRNGLPSACNWLPTIAEVKKACEARMEPIRRAEARERAWKGLPAPGQPREERPTLEEIKEKLGENYGLKGGPLKKRDPELTDDEIKARLKHLEETASMRTIEVSDQLKAMIAEKSNVE